MGGSDVHSSVRMRLFCIYLSDDSLAVLIPTLGVPIDINWEHNVKQKLLGSKGLLS